MFLQRSVRNLATRITTIRGDGIGPEVLAATKEVIKATNAPVKFDDHSISEISGYTQDEYNSLISSLRKNKVCLKGFILAGRKFDVQHQETLAMQIRHDLGVFANAVHVKSHQGVKTKHKNIDFIVIRETTEGEYCGQEHECVPGVVEALKVMTKKKATQIAHFAFDYALRHNRKKVTCVHKANIMKLGDGLFMRSCEEVSKLYPNIEFEPMIVDNTCMQLVSNPYQFDVMVMPNLYGNIIQNLGAGLIGGSGFLAGASYSNDIAFFEPGARYTFNSGAGRDIANPTAMFMTAGNMLAHIGLGRHGASIKDSVRKVIKGGKCKTQDMGGYASTTEFTSAVIELIKPLEAHGAYSVITD